ncbi:E3 ubiquitin-protein ligase Bre1-like isoform X7, partial [Leptotrombidium deliense]
EGAESEDVPKLDKAVKDANIELQNENKSLNTLVTQLHEKHHTISLRYAEMKDKVNTLELANDELKLRIDELEYELNRTRSRELRLDEHLQETREKLRDFQLSSGGESDTAKEGKGISAVKPRDSVSKAKVEELEKDLEYEKELSANRLAELEELNMKHKESLKEIDKLKMDLQCLPESVVVETVEYKCLQSHFSVLYNESMQLKTQLEDTRTMIQNAKTMHLRQIEHMESEELSMQKRLRTEVIQLEDQLAQVRKEYEMLRLEFEQTIAANEQTAPINREMRHLITSLQNHNQQLKGESQRYKRRLKDANHEVAKLKHQIDQLNASHQQASTVKVEVKPEPVDQSSENRKRSESESNVKVKEEVSDEKPVDVGIVDSSSAPVVKQESDVKVVTTSSSVSNSNPSTSASNASHPHRHHIPKKEEIPDTQQTSATSTVVEKTDARKPESDVIRDLKNQLKRTQEQLKEMKILLDTYKTAPKDLRDKAQLLMSERKYKTEVEELRKQVSKYQEASRRKLTDEEAMREISKLKETIQQLQRNLAAQKQEDEALLNEMEVTGSAFEDMKEQNLRLIQQLREKDDANFKLMSERIKSQQIQKLLKEEKESLMEQIISLHSQVEAQNQVVRKLEEKERLLQNNLSTIEKELSMRQQAMELHKRKAIESAQSAADLKLHLEKYSTQLKEAQTTVADKTSVLQETLFKTKRLQEDLSQQKKQSERAKMFELASTADEVLLEEIKDYKSQLTCPSCKNKRKDAVLTKCFHVFCFDCLKTRYETRQRKCPKCNAPFGANDFHRLYLS